MRRAFLFFFYLLKDVSHVLCHVYWGSDRVDDGTVAVSLHAERLSMFFLEGICESSEESLACLDHFYGSVLGLVSLLRLRVYHDGVLAVVEAFHLLLQIVLVVFPFKSVRELSQIGLFLFEECGHGAVGGIPFFDVFSGCLVDGEDGPGIVVYEGNRQNQDNGDDAVSDGNLERYVVLLHEILMLQFSCAKLMKKRVDAKL